MGSPYVPARAFSGMFRPTPARPLATRGESPVPVHPEPAWQNGPSCRTRAQAMTTSLTLAAAAPTVCTGPLPASTPTGAW